jgi:hypothetical protein
MIAHAAAQAKQRIKATARAYEVFKPRQDQNGFKTPSSARAMPGRDFRHAADSPLWNGRALVAQKAAVD